MTAEDRLKLERDGKKPKRPALPLHWCTGELVDGKFEWGPAYVLETGTAAKLVHVDGVVIAVVEREKKLYLVGATNTLGVSKVNTHQYL